MKKQNIGNNVRIKENVIIGDNVIIEDNVYIDYNTIIKDNVIIREGTFVGANCILGEFLVDTIMSENKVQGEILEIGKDSIIRSGTIIYSSNKTGHNFQTGHNVTIRENNTIGNHVSLGTLSDVQGYCNIGNYVRVHSNVHMGHKSIINDFVWIFPYVVLTNDPTPPSDRLAGVTIDSFAVICTGSIILPGVHIKGDSLVAASSNVTKDVNNYEVVGGNPAKVISDVRKIKNHMTGEAVYPWRYTFSRGMPWEESDYDTWYNNLNIEKGNNHE